MRPGSNGTTARPRIREQHYARLNARPHKRVNVRKPFEVRVRARFRVRTRHFESVSAYYVRLCDSLRCLSCVVRSDFLLERERARSLRRSEPGRVKRMACTMKCRVEMCDTLTCRNYGELFTNCPLSLVKPRRLSRSRTPKPCLMVRSDTNLKSSNL